MYIYIYTEGKSKRMTLKDKYKIQRKCADAKRKAKKEAKANPQSKKGMCISLMIIALCFFLSHFLVYGYINELVC